MFIQYEPSLFNSSQLLASNPTNSQNVNPSQLMSSHIVQPRNAVQNVQSVQPSTYFPQSQPTLPQTGYYPSQAQPTSALQGALQQVAATAPQFSLHAFGNQGQGLGLTLQQSASNTNHMNSSQHMSLSNTAGNQPTANKQSSQFNSIIQQQSPQNNAMKSPSQNMTPNSMLTPNSMMNTALSALSPNSKVFTSQVQNRQPPRFPNVAQLQGNKYGNTFVAQQLSGAASVVRPSIMVGSMMRSNTAPPTQPTFPPPIQRPGVQQNTTLITQTSIPTPVIVTQTTNPSMKALHEKQRREVLAHAQSFLNPQNKPSIKSPPKADSLEDKNLSDAISSITESKSDNQLATTKEKN
ncbi:integrator complex subunit 3 homolog [Patella vulgata]|uniref:integrator complex subunit 3 homolog n=1 Tax=Patella vulgata TaxID=6465 RepID=UPI00217F638E|nr:integrator complex subunit 3 homolog [Patella vulgata]